MKVEVCDFDAAKLRVARILNRPDLIRTKASGKGTGRVFQATDAASLLNAPADRRDDALPVAYLAHRLGVAVDAVPVPSTTMVGLKALAYYDPPPQGSKAKPKLVGEFPCAVFGTAAADGRAHAHRIYVVPDGAGKADLGPGPDGQLREPKKSAKLIGNTPTSGCAVVWGDPDTATHIIVTEGIETGAAVALAFAAEIKAAHIAVAAAISAVGMEGFQPYGATLQLTIAADRDEAPKANGRPGSRRGEAAARKLALAHHDQLLVDIAMPGQDGESVDWLDVLLRDGVDAVRAGIGAAERFEPAPTELEDVARGHSRAEELRAIAAAYPLPAMDTITLRYDYTAADKVKVHKVIRWEVNPEIGKKEPVMVPIATPFGIPARLRHADQADAYGLRCVVQDMNGKPRDVDFDRAGLARMGAAEIRAQLFSAGLRTEDDGDMIAVRCLKAADPEQEILIVQRPGWHEIAGCPYPFFVAPCGHVLGVPAGVAVELAAATRIAPSVARSGTMSGWLRAVEAAVTVTGCEHWILGVLAAFVGPLIGLTGMDTCGISLSGMSTSGKSTAQRLAVSAWSTPDIRRPGLFQSARTTDNAVEALAQRGTGTVLALDEIAHISGKAAAQMIYTIAGGVGKQRMTADAQMRASYAWTTFAILSGECSLEEKIRRDGAEWVAGMAVRLVDIDITGVNRMVSAEALRQISAIDQHFGHAGPAFVAALIRSGLHRQAAALRDRVLKAARILAGGDQTDGATVRAAIPLSLMMTAGELAKSFELIPQAAAIQDTIQWAWDRFRQSTDAMALDPEVQVISSVRTWIAERWGVTIKDARVDDGVNNREAIAWFDDDAVYIPKTRLREAASNTQRESQIASILDQRGLLAKRPEPDRLYVRYVPNIGRVACYALRRSEFGRSGIASDPDAFTVHEGGRHG